MKKLFLLMMVLSLLSCGCEPFENRYTYKVHYRTHKDNTDYTNAVEHLANGGIRYTDHFGNQVERFGTFSVVKIKKHETN